MEATWIAIAIVAGLVVVIIAPVFAVQWARVRRAEVDGRVKQDMLARGLSVEEIERLSTTASARAAQIAADTQVKAAQIAADTQLKAAQIAADTEVKAAQIAADLKRDMLARGLSVEEIERLLNPSPAPAPPPKSLRGAAFTLATAIEGMAEAGKDTDDIAALLDVFLRRHTVPAETGQESNQALQTTRPPLDRPDSGKRELPDHKAEPLAAADRPRD